MEELQEIEFESDCEGAVLSRLHRRTVRSTIDILIEPALYHSVNCHTGLCQVKQRFCLADRVLSQTLGASLGAVLGQAQTWCSL